MVGTSATRNGSLTGRIRMNGSACEASLGPDGTLTWRGEEEEGEQCLALESEALGFEMMDDDNENGRRRMIRVRGFVSCGGVAAAGKKKKKGISSRRKTKTRKDYVLEFESDEMLNLWTQALTHCFNSFGRPKRLFIILNPFGGKKRAQKIFQDEIKPQFEAAGVLYTLQETRYHLHAQEIANKLDFLNYDGIVCVSGDGVLVEIVNGLLQREDWDAAIKVPLGIIPAGTGNGIAKSLLASVGETYSISNVVFSIIRGHKQLLDVATVMQGTSKFFSILMLTWGLIADIDMESEKYRWMGSARFDFYSVLRIVNLRRYHGYVHFVPAPGYEAFGERLQQNGNCGAVTGALRRDQEFGDKVQHVGYQGPSNCADSLEWRSVDGPFVLVMLNNVPWCTEGSMPAPDAKFSDGYLDLLIIKDCPKSVILALMLKTANGSHVQSPYVMYLKIKAFRLEPGQRVENPKKGGIIDCDGEVLARGNGTFKSHQQDADPMKYGPPIDMTIEKGLATIFCP